MQRVSLPLRCKVRVGAGPFPNAGNNWTLLPFLLTQQETAAGDGEHELSRCLPLRYRVQRSGEISILLPAWHYRAFIPSQILDS